MERACLMRRAQVPCCLALIAVTGCLQPAAPPVTLGEPTSLQEGSQRLAPLIRDIVTAVEKGNFQACDAQLHDAMFLANRLAELAATQDAPTSAKASQELYALLMSAHNSAHGGADDKVGTFRQQSEEIAAAYATYRRAIAAQD